MWGTGKEPVLIKPCSPLIFSFLLPLFNINVRKLTKFIAFLTFFPSN